MRQQTLWTRTILAACVLTPVLSALVTAEDPEQIRARRLACGSNLKQLVFALRMYAQDHADRLPPADRWGTVVRPYLRGQVIPQCPAHAAPNSYAFNSNLSGAPLSWVRRHPSVPVLFDSRLREANARGTERAVADPPRHEGGNNYVLLDAQLMWSRKPPPFGQPYRAAGRPEGLQ